MFDDNKIVRSLWIDDSINLMQRICINSFIEQGHTFYIYTYGEISNLPDRVIVCDAEPIIPRSLVFKDVKNSYATFSDWFRMNLLYLYGGWWVDMDVVCIKPFTHRESFVFASEVMSALGDTRICNAIMKMEKHSLYGDEMLTYIAHTLEVKDRRKILWTELGATLIERCVNHNNNLEKYIHSTKAFCPVHYFNFHQLFLTEDFKFSQETFAVHLWNKMWQQANYSSSVLNNNKNSFWQKLKVMYG